MSGLVIIGGGLAGAKAAEAARDAGYDGPLVLVGDEAHAPYERPPLSKGVLRGETEPGSATVVTPETYAARSIDLVLGVAVTALDGRARRATLADGRSLSFDVAVLATGASPRRLPVPGADLQGVHHLRTLDDAVALRDALRAASRVAVVGAGWIGTEVAASARQVGAEVVLIDPAEVPLQRVLGTTVGRLFRELHAEHGVVLRLGRGVVELRGGDAVAEVVLDDGTTEAADVVVVGIGVTPNVQLAREAGLDVGDGIVVDEWLRTSVPGVLAAGDVASAWHPVLGRRIRVEHWSAALHQGGTAGRNAVGAAEVYDRLPYFFSDQYDLGMEYVGLAGADGDVVLRGDVDDRKLLAFWLRDERVVAAMNVNVWDVVDELRALVTASPRVERAVLADPSVPLGALR